MILNRPVPPRRSRIRTAALTILGGYALFLLRVAFTILGLSSSESSQRTITIIDDPMNSFFIFPEESVTKGEHHVKNCPVKCRIIRKEESDADARFFHIPNVQQNKTYVLPQRTHADQVYLGFSYEAPLYYSWLHDPTFMAQFDHTFGYPKTRPGYHTNVPIGPFSFNLAENGGLSAVAYSTELDFSKVAAPSSEQRGPNELASVNWVASNCRDKNGRQKLVEDLMKLVAIDSYGLCLHNKDFPFTNPSEYAAEDSSKSRLLQSYSFNLAFENAHCEEYVSEKVWQPLQVGTIPIFFGTETVRDLLPSRDAAIFVSDFDSLTDLAFYLKNLTGPSDSARRKRAKHLEWRTRPFAELDPGFQQAYSYSRWLARDMNFDCLLCSTVLEKQIERKSLKNADLGARPFPACDKSKQSVVEPVQIAPA